MTGCGDGLGEYTGGYVTASALGAIGQLVLYHLSRLTLARDSHGLGIRLPGWGYPRAPRATRLPPECRGVPAQPLACDFLPPLSAHDLPGDGIDKGGRDEADQPLPWGLLFQPRFFDRALRTVKEYHEKVEYIHLNPVKAGLARRPEDGPWSSVHDYTGNISDAPVTPSGLSVDRV